MVRCPWTQFSQAPADFCEASLCAAIRQPGNTWSNIGFLLVGFWILHCARKEGQGHLKGVGYISLVTGVGSAAFHATETFWGEFLDYSGMYLGASYMLAVNFRRWRGWGKGAVFLLFWGSFGLSLLVLMSRSPYVRSFYVAEALLAGVAEIFLYASRKRSIRYFYLGAFYAVFLPAFTLWLLDVSKVMCHPDNHWLSGHALWHLLNASAFYCLYRFYTQFEELRYREG